MGGPQKRCPDGQQGALARGNKAIMFLKPYLSQSGSSCCCGHDSVTLHPFQQRIALGGSNFVYTYEILPLVYAYEILPLVDPSAPGWRRKAGAAAGPTCQRRTLWAAPRIGPGGCTPAHWGVFTSKFKDANVVLKFKCRTSSHGAATRGHAPGPHSQAHRHNKVNGQPTCILSHFNVTDEG